MHEIVNISHVEQNSSKQEFNKLQERNDYLEDQNNTLRHENDSYQEEIERLEIAVNNLSKANAKLQIENEKYRKENSKEMCDEETEYIQAPITSLMDTTVASKFLDDSIQLDNTYIRQTAAGSKLEGILIDCYEENKELKKQIETLLSEATNLKTKYKRFKKNAKFEIMKIMLLVTANTTSFIGDIKESILMSLGKVSSSHKMGDLSKLLISEEFRPKQNGQLQQLHDKYKEIYGRLDSFLENFTSSTRVFPLDFKYEYSRPFKLASIKQ